MVMWSLPSLKEKASEDSKQNLDLYNNKEEEMKMVMAVQ